MERVILIEDEKDIRDLIAYNLRKEGYEVMEAASGEEGLELAGGSSARLILLDIMLPGLGGLEVLDRLKRDERAGNIPVVIISAKGEEDDIVRGLELGADDYVTKPFSPKVLMARVRAVLRRRPRGSRYDDAVCELPDLGLAVHTGRHEVLIEDERINLTITEFEILKLLVEHRGWVFTRSQIVDRTKGQDHHITERTIDVHVLNIRKKLGSLGKHLETVRGVGYRFRD